MMVNQFILSHQLSPIDVIVAKKKNGFGRILNHYIVYLGDNTFIGNLGDRVQIISNSKLVALLREYDPVEVRRFHGNQHEIQSAKKRAFERINKAYNFLWFNCEHYANWVQYGNSTSSQVFYGALLLGTVLTSIFANKTEKHN